jgi:hypothetical protein
VAALPFHYYLALREDWIRSNTITPAGETGGDGEDVDAQSLLGEMA